MVEEGVDHHLEEVYHLEVKPVDSKEHPNINQQAVSEIIN